ncbi:LysM peptidoglycan-binding domain-containing protein [Solidesulfovibrio magneticus]|uniref:LysM domain-containing protein n=1 Tax=Solidesulfovibrio magneticus (strain ATCC 700980 / DSM 13731 / RS-1) TaxID=573370 RepID=C4XR23_SOLM1|nr:LysM domain-containing protein [Solidesulfovibrio magneticus]BAH77903.1 hypothetical protein DMR_44120 [Solidesulfovibrio magneticus RS-1]
MLRGTPTVILLVALAGAALGLTAGCSKYDGLERNMQYVSDDLARKDAALAWQQVTAAHAAWQKAGQSHDPADAAFAAYQDAYARYAVTYNELLDRTNAPGGFSSRLRSPTDTLPPPPPGVSMPSAQASPAPAPEMGPAGRELTDTTPARPLAGGAATPAPTPTPTAVVPAAPAPAVTPTAAPVPGKAKVVPAGPGSYIIQPGDTLYSIAKRHGLSEKRLAEANGITDPTKIAVGKALTIPAP